jgi:hypothetical protein
MVSNGLMQIRDFPDMRLETLLAGNYDPYFSFDQFIDVDTAFGRYVKNSSKKGFCVPEAYKLRSKNHNQGRVYWVEEIGHAYYIPDPNDLQAMAQNQADNGYEGFPPLHVFEVLQSGKPMGENLRAALGPSIETLSNSILALTGKIDYNSIKAKSPFLFINS